MKTHTICAALGVTLLATSAYAQTRPAARPAATPAAPAAQAGTLPSNPGPVIAGVCMLDGPTAIRQSSAGQATSARLQVLGQQVQAELKPTADSLNAENTRIRALPAAQQQAPGQALTTRVQQFQRLQQQRAQELELTQARALEQIETQLSAVVSQIYVQRGCGLMLDRNSTIYANPAMDTTAAAVAALNARMPTITFNRATLPATPAAARP